MMDHQSGGCPELIHEQELLRALKPALAKQVQQLANQKP